MSPFLPKKGGVDSNKVVEPETTIRTVRIVQAHTRVYAVVRVRDYLYVRVRVRARACVSMRLRVCLRVIAGLCMVKRPFIRVRCKRFTMCVSKRACLCRLCSN